MTDLCDDGIILITVGARGNETREQIKVHWKLIMQGVCVGDHIDWQLITLLFGKKSKILRYHDSFFDNVRKKKHQSDSIRQLNFYYDHHYN